MLKFVLHTHIDKTKWDNCISKIDKVHFYPLYGYLSSLCQWNALILEENDVYTAVVPLPFKQKFGIRFLYQPFFCQQLGVFANRSLSELETKQIAHLIKKNHLFGNLQWTHKQGFEKDFSFLAKTNFELPLNKSFEELSANFNQNRKRNLKKLHELDHLSVTQVSDIQSIAHCINGFQKQMKDRIACFSQHTYEIFLKGNQSVLSQIKPTLIQIYIQQELVSESYFVEYNNRIVYLMGYTLANYTNLSVSSLAFEKIIHANACSGKILDFDGSSVAGIAQFYQSFGAHKTEYFELSLRPMFLSLKKLFPFI